MGYPSHGMLIAWGNNIISTRANIPLSAANKTCDKVLHVRRIQPENITGEQVHEFHVTCGQDQGKCLYSPGDPRDEGQAQTLGRIYECGDRSKLNKASKRPLTQASL